MLWEAAYASISRNLEFGRRKVLLLPGAAIIQKLKHHINFEFRNSSRPSIDQNTARDQNLFDPVSAWPPVPATTRSTCIALPLIGSERTQLWGRALFSPGNPAIYGQSWPKKHWLANCERDADDLTVCQIDV